MCVFLLPKSFDCFEDGGRHDLLVLGGLDSAQPVYIRYVYASIHVSFISVIYSVQPMNAPARVAQFMDKPLQQFIDRTQIRFIKRLWPSYHSGSWGIEAGQVLLSTIKILLSGVFYFCSMAEGLSRYVDNNFTTKPTTNLLS